MHWQACGCEMIKRSAYKMFLKRSIVVLFFASFYEELLANLLYAFSLSRNCCIFLLEASCLFLESSVGRRAEPENFRTRRFQIVS